MATTFYGTPEGVALDRGAAEAVRRLRMPAVNSFTPGPTPAMQPLGSPQAQAFRESLRAASPQPTAAPAAPAPITPAAPAAPQSLAARAGRVATAPFRAIAAAPGAAVNALNADVGSVVKGIARSPVLRAAGAVGLGVGGASNLFDVATGHTVPTEDYRAALGVTDGMRENVRSMLGKVGIGENGADLVNDLAVRTAGVLGDMFVPGFNARGTARGTAGVAQPTPQPGSTLRTGQMPLPAGVTPSTAGPGRGSPLDPRRTDMNPADPRFGAARDFGPELAGVRNLPDDLRSGVVFKTKGANGETVYSGRDVAAGAQMVDGMGRRTGRLPDARTNVLDTREGYRQNLLELQRNAAERATAPGPGGVGSLGNSTGIRLNDTVAANAGSSAIEKAMREASPRGRLRLTEVMNANTEAAQNREMQGSIAAAQTGATIRGQDLSAGTARYGADTSASTLRRGQDMDYAEKIDAKKMDLMNQQAQRARIAAAWQGTTDPQVAAARLAANGVDPTSALAVANGQRAGAEASAKAIDRNLEHLAVGVDGKGNSIIDPAKLAEARKTAQGVVPGYATASPTAQIAGQPQGLGPVAALTGMNSLRNDSLITRIFPQTGKPAMTTLPDLAGAEYGPAGITDVMPWSKRSIGDIKVRLRDGTEHFIPHGMVDEDVLSTLKRNGATQGR